VSEENPPAPIPKRKWLRRVGWTLLALLLLLVLFHRPILVAAVHAIAIKIAAKQNVDLTLTVEGSVISDLSLKNVLALPKEKGASPVERITIEEVTVRYNIYGLLRRGAPEFLKSYRLRNADIEVKPVAGTHEQKNDLASTLHDMIQQPALFSDRVDIENLNLIAHTPDGEFAVKGVSIFLDPVQAGEVRIARLQIPRVRTWDNLAAAATYARRDLILRGLALDPQIVIEQLELDASQRAQGINRLAINGALFGGSAQFEMWMHELKKKKNAPNIADVKIESRLRNFSLEKLSAYFHTATPAIGSISDSTISLSGNPNSPASWTGSMTSIAESVRVGGATLDRGSVRLDAKDGTAVLSAELDSGQNRLVMQAQGTLPQTTDGFAGSGLDGTLTIDAGHLNEVASQLTQGAATANGTITLRNKVFSLKLDGALNEIVGANFELASAGVKLEATKSIDTKDPNAPPFEGLQTRVDATFSGIIADKYALDSGTLNLSTNNAQVRLEAVDFRRASDAITASGNLTLPRDLKSWDTAPFDVKFSMVAPSLSALNNEPNLTSPNAQIEVNGTLANGADGYSGNVNAAVTNITYQDFTAESLTLKVAITHSIATIEALDFALNQTDGFTGKGRVELRKPFTYDGSLQANVRDLSKFNALVQNIKNGIGGSLSLNWQGNGNVAEMQHSGNIALALSNAKAAEVQTINAQIAGTYSPELIDLPTFWITTNKGDLLATIGLKDRVLTIGNILVKQANKPLLSGSMSLPLDLRTLKNPESIVPLDEPVSAQVTSSDLALETFFPKDQAPVKGIAKATFNATGTVRDLDARLQFSARNLQAKAAPKLAPTTVDLDARLVADELSLKGKVQQPAINPIEIAGTLPLPFDQIVKQRKIDENSPVQLSVRLPRSSVAFVSQVTPAVRYIEGSASVSADIAGTIAQPEFSGSALLDLPAVRLANQDMPAINGFRGDLRFEKNRLTLNRFGGDISGGSFNANGTITFVKLTDPQIDLRMTSNGALLVRNESLTVRADSDVRINGPLNAASVTGNVGITRSRFFREIDILPIELPGRPAPKPPETKAGFAFEKPPLRDWKFNVMIKTKDPFAVRGNLANGGVTLDLALVGTGRSPTLDGTLTIENFVASLPFSKLDVHSGHVYFSPNEPFEPRLDIQGTSTMRDYNINVYIYGTASEPQTIFSSEPPLPQEDIIALLATGSTASQLTGNGDVLAGRAAALLFQKLYHKMFKSREPSENESFLGRFNVDVGAVDPRTGQQEVSTKFKLGENFDLIGDLDVGGNIRGQVKYLLRFR